VNGDHPPQQHDPLREPAAAVRTPPSRSLTVGQRFRIAAVAALLVLIGAATGFAASTFIPTEYGARVDILYPLSVEQPTGFLRDDRNLTTQLLLIESRQVLTEVGAEHGLTPEQMDEKISATIVESSEIIRVEARDGSRDTGVVLADAVVSRYMAYANVFRPSPVRQYVQSQLDETRRLLDTRPEDPVLLARENGLVAQLDSITTDELSSPRPSILAPAYSLPDPVSIGPVITTAAGTLLGLLVAAPVVLWLARARRRR
jgi:hypothetical protein